ncbi:hypothetical protein QFA96_16695 [Pseudomonas sp. Ap32]|nr:hypothetical protein QFA96_16695 [Pseudomonas sp. Ap32]
MGWDFYAVIWLLLNGSLADLQRDRGVFFEALAVGFSAQLPAINLEEGS